MRPCARSATLVEEVRRLIDAGGGRMRPLLCVWGFAAALELLHTMALIHDDLIDGADERRGVASAHVHAGREAPGSSRAAWPEVGRAVALVAGDLAAVLADELLADAGFDAATLAPARAIYDRTRVRMAAGQVAALIGAPPADRDEALRRAALRGGAYSVEAPLRIGAALAGAGDPTTAGLAAFGEALGRAFQLADDLRDGDAAAGIDDATALALVDEATASLPSLPEAADRELRAIASAVRAAIVAATGDAAAATRSEAAP